MGKKIPVQVHFFLRWVGDSYTSVSTWWSCLWELKHPYRGDVLAAKKMRNRFVKINSLLRTPKVPKVFPFGPPPPLPCVLNGSAASKSRCKTISFTARHTYCTCCKSYTVHVKVDSVNVVQHNPSRGENLTVPDGLFL